MNTEGIELKQQAFVEELRIILSKEQDREVIYSEAREISLDLIDFYELLLNGMGEDEKE